MIIAPLDVNDIYATRPAPSTSAMKKGCGQTAPLLFSTGCKGALRLFGRQLLLPGAAFQQVRRRLGGERPLFLELRGDDVLAARLALGFVGAAGDVDVDRDRDLRGQPDLDRLHAQC